jgi:hypothetical protein
MINLAKSTRSKRITDNRHIRVHSYKLLNIEFSASDFGKNPCLGYYCSATGIHNLPYASMLSICSGAFSVIIQRLLDRHTIDILISYIVYIFPRTINHEYKCR